MNPILRNWVQFRVGAIPSEPFIYLFFYVAFIPILKRSTILNDKAIGFFDIKRFTNIKLT